MHDGTRSDLNWRGACGRLSLQTAEASQRWPRLWATLGVVSFRVHIRLAAHASGVLLDVASSFASAPLPTRTSNTGDHTRGVYRTVLWVGRPRPAARFAVALSEARAFDQALRQSCSAPVRSSDRG
jgi:hypothetical protein